MNSIPNLTGKINSLFIGKIESRWPDKAPSAIGKRSTNATLCLEWNGFVEDRQADLKVHGGPEKAVHHYAAEHMNFWRRSFPEQAGQFVPGCFGENISTLGLNEGNLCLGDIFSMGSAKVQICQGRQPCWKLNAHMEINEMAAAFQRTALTGWYYRVLETGSVRVGDMVALIERPLPEWHLKRLINARFNPRLDPEQAEELSNLQAISESWREAFRKKQSKNFKENTAARLNG